MDVKELNLQYQGFANTQNLWVEHEVYHLQQFVLPSKTSIVFNEPLPKNIRLGKRVEQFVFHQLKQQSQISIVFQNLQIQQEKHTLGEMDTLILMDKKPVHLEIIYKFYLYDDSVGTSELEHWIGPNRKDSLIQKLDKLKNKQLPLLYHPETLKYLEKHNIHVDDIQQQVLFKAQLFVPFNKTTYNFKLINPDCLMGFYLKQEELSQFKMAKFYIPSKANWLIEPHAQVSWLTYTLFMQTVSPILEKKTAPLVWIKSPNGELKKCFVVWWL
ncbi:DUF1853 family protein [Xanthomarina sp. F2636L]|uniref:DUF1853 family protein n=1 Tax=Xanthomarina sp. F2636L TaxID=2996018 RepID=UPI00225DEA81|nr:DUF1853 family protein [Xanthomarina sp. F2636L]MCX7549677.1 DUF1853 family protein [Xanthomarina sp. F2636L]